MEFGQDTSDFGRSDNIDSHESLNGQSTHQRGQGASCSAMPFNMR